MDNPRILVWIALAVVAWLNINAWQTDFASKPQPTPQLAAPTANAPTTNAALPPLPTAPTPTSAGPDPAIVTGPSATSQPVVAAKTVRVVTDVLDMQISTRGGELLKADLLKYPQVKDQPDNPVHLFSTEPAELFLAKSGLRATGGRTAPTDEVTFEAAADVYRIKSSERELVVPLTWTDGQGLKVVKSYIFRPGSYQIDLRYDITNESGAPWTGASYVQLLRHYVPVKRSYLDVTSSAYRGPAVFNDKYIKLDVEKESSAKYAKQASNGFMAAVQHHFVVAAVPPEKSAYDYLVTVEPDKDYSIAYSGPPVSVAPGAAQSLTEKLFVGPKLYRELDPLHPDLYLTADYGWLSTIARPLFKLLNFVHGLLGNWGWSIVATTFLIKLAFYKLTAASGRSMAKMRNLGPRIKAIQERYKDDREKLGREMMDIYKREKINPLAGCLPVLIQIPFFFAYYWVLLEAVEMRQAPFLGWINDLSSRDPYFILPALMCAAMVGQFRLQPMPSTDPVQAKIFAFMPVIMSITMAFFPAGLVLYWLTNTLLSIAQQWRINKLVALETKKA